MPPAAREIDDYTLYMNPRLFEEPLGVPSERPPEVQYHTLEQLVTEAGFRTFPDWLRPGPIHSRTQHQL